MKKWCEHIKFYQYEKPLWIDDDGNPVSDKNNFCPICGKPRPKEEKTK